MSAELATTPHFLLPGFQRAVEQRGRVLAEEEGLESMLRRAWEQARAVHPSVGTGWSVLAAWLADRVDPDRPVTSLARVSAPDLYLAAAVIHGDEIAGGEFDRELVEVARAVKGELEDHRPVDEVCFALCRRFLVGEQGSPGLVRYRGRGRLRAWMIAEARRAARPHRVRTDPFDALPFRRSSEAEVTATLRSPPPGRKPVDSEEVAARTERRLPPELRGVDRAQLVRRSFAAAIATMEGRDRDLLRRFYLEGRSIGEIADNLGAPEDATSRRVASAKRRLIDATRTQLQARASLRDDEVAQLIGILRGGLGVKLGRSIAAKDAARGVELPA